MTLREVGELTGLSRSRLSELISAGVLPARIEVTERGVARRLVQRVDVEKFLRDRTVEVQQPRGRGRPPKAPKQDPTG